MPGLIPLKAIYLCPQYIFFAGWRTKLVTESILKEACHSPLHQWARFHIRNQEQVHHIPLTPLCCVSLAGRLYPHKCGKLFRRTVFLGCTATTKPSGREQRAHLTSSDCREKGRAISAALHQVIGVVLPSQVQGEEAALLLKLVLTSGFSPFCLVMEGSSLI